MKEGKRHILTIARPGWPIQARFWLEWGCFNTFQFCHGTKGCYCAGDDLRVWGFCVSCLHRTDQARLEIDETKKPTQAKTGLEWANRLMWRLAEPPFIQFCCRTKLSTSGRARFQSRLRASSLGDSLAVLLNTLKNGFARNAREDLTVELRM
jgi:hypothetical protein